MILYTGGFGQGKLTYVLERHKGSVFDGAKDDITDIGSYNIINKYNLLVKRLIAEGTDPLEFTKSVNADIVIGDEVGCGIVPVSKEDTIYRESVGRCMCLLAEKSEGVVRIICGMGMVIK